MLKPLLKPILSAFVCVVLIPTSLAQFPKPGSGGGGISDLSSGATGVLPSANGGTGAANAFKVGSDGNVYRALTGSPSADPTTDDGSTWELSAVNSSVTLNVPSRFSTIITAMAFLRGARISTSATATIQIADGSYNYSTNAVNLYHPDGARIRIIGNTASEASVSITSALASSTTAVPGFFYLINGGTFGEIDGITLVGPGRAVTELGGVIARNGSSITLGTHMTIQGFYGGIMAHFGSYIMADSAVVSNGGDGNVWAYGNSMISCSGCTSTGASTYFSGSGYLADNASYLFLTSATATGNLNGLSLWNGSFAKVDSATFSSNTTAGVNFQDGSVVGRLEGVPSALASNGAPYVFAATILSYGAAYYQPNTITNSHTTGIAVASSVANNAGDNFSCFAGGATQTLRNGFGLGTGDRLDCAANGFTSFSIGNFDSKPFVLGTNNLNRVYIDGSGNVGIGGITNADDKLQVNGVIDATSGFKSNNVAGLSATVVVKGSDGNNCNLVYSGGIVTSTTCP